MAPHPLLVLLPDRETRNTHIFRDVIDDERAKTGIHDQGDGQGQIDKDRHVVQRRLDDRGPAQFDRHSELTR